MSKKSLLGESSSTSEARLKDIMSKAVVQDGEFFSSSHTAGGSNLSYEKKKADNSTKRREEKNTLSQWYGIKRVRKTQEIEQELELLKYRNFLDRDKAHRVPMGKADDGGTASDFVEFGYFSDVGQRRRKQTKSFADEWIKDKQELKDMVETRMKINVDRNKKAKVMKEKKIKKTKSLEGRKGKSSVSGAKRKRKSNDE
jgi:hypothetical protein